MTKIIKNHTKTLILLGICLALTIEPAYAQAWASKANTALDNIITGLKLLGRGWATVILIWAIYQYMANGKRLIDMQNWIIGAVLFASITEIIALFFG